VASDLPDASGFFCIKNLLLSLATITYDRTTMKMTVIRLLMLALWASASLVQADQMLRGAEDASLVVDANDGTNAERQLGGYDRLPKYTYVYKTRNLKRCQADCKGKDSRCAGSLVCRYAAGNRNRYSKYCRGKPSAGLDYCVPYHYHDDDNGYGGDDDNGYGHSDSEDDRYGHGGGYGGHRGHN
jgi:hypothetical protein